MSSLTLKFKSANLLWQFKQAIKADEVSMNLQECTLTCNCSAEDIKLALTQYGAVVVREEKKV